MTPADRLANIELSLIRQINALATPLSTNLGIGEPNLEPDETLRAFARRAATTSWHYSANAGALSLRKRLCANTSFDPANRVLRHRWHAGSALRSRPGSSASGAGCG
jgi:aspartate/methionine/tyrosine aminotransferase